MPINIRPMLKKDKPALMRILRNTPEFKPVEVTVAEELIDAYLESPATSGYFVLIAESPSLAGYICYGQTPLTDSTWDVYWMATAQEKRGQGIGSALLKAAEQEIKKAGGRLVVIETSSLPSYENTRRFHLGQGYQQNSFIEDFYAPGDGKLTLLKRIPGPS